MRRKFTTSVDNLTTDFDCRPKRLAGRGGDYYLHELWTTAALRHWVGGGVLGMTLNCIDIFIVTGSFLY